MSDSVFKAYDVRGDFPTPLTPHLCTEIARALPLRSVVIGRDARASSLEIFQALLKGFLDLGVEVVDLGLVPSPLVVVAGHEYDLDGAIMITASHNPLPQNGLKITLRDGPLTGYDIQQLLEGFLAHEKGRAQKDLETKNVIPIYIDKILSTCSPQPFRVVWDAGHGAMGPVLNTLFPHLPKTSVVIRSDPDSSKSFLDPSKPEHLRHLGNVVRNIDADIGFAFDADGDRLGIVDRLGNPVSIDRIFPCLVRPLGSCNVLLDQKCSGQTFEALEGMGCKPQWTPTGHALIKKALNATHAKFAGERSGHIFFKHWYNGADDPLYAALQFLSFWDGDFQECEPHGMNITLAVQNREEILNRIRTQLLRDKKEFLSIDGIRFSHPFGWWLIRSSNTEPVLNGRYEAYRCEDLACVKKDLETYLPELEGLSSVS